MQGATDLPPDQVSGMEVWTGPGGLVLRGVNAPTP